MTTVQVHRGGVLAILLAAIRHAAKPADPELAEKIYNLYLVNRYAKGLEHYKVLPTQSDRPRFFAVLDVGPIDGQGDSRVSEAYEFFRQMLRGPDLDGEPLDFALLEQVVTGRLELVSITLDQADNEYRIFESLNYKGEPLTQADLLRNYFLMRVPAADQERIYEQLWAPMQQNLGAALADFFRYDHMSRGEFAREGDVYAAWKLRLDPLETAELVGELVRLSADSRLYQCLIAPAQEQDAALRRGLERLNRWGGQTMYPFLLNVYRALRDGDLTREGFIEILRFIESFLVRRLFAAVPTNALNRLFARLWQQLPPGIGLVEATHATLSEPSRRWPRNDEFRAAILKFPLYVNGRPEQRRLILESLEESYEHKEKVDLGALTIEHIMPQTLTPEWRELLGPRAAQVHARYLHTLGNLTLTGYNSPLSNSPFAEKREIFAQSNVEMNKRIAQAAAWNEEQLEARAGEMAERALKIWPAPMAVEPTATLLPDPTAAPTRGWKPEDIAGATVDDVRLALERRPLGDAQLGALRALYAAGEAGLWYPELAAALSLTRRELSGVLGSLGTRINRTPGFGQQRTPGVGLILDWRHIQGEWHYRLLPIARQAMEALGLV